MNIEMIDLVAQPDFIVPDNGSYLVKTQTRWSTRFFNTNVTRCYDARKRTWHLKFGCNNQKVIAVSSKPVK